MDSLIKLKKENRSKNLVFTSAGENTNLKQWTKGKNGFDIWVVNYGDSENKSDYINDCDYYLERKGGKFPNLKYCYEQWREIFTHYDAIYVSDDDIIISGEEIDSLFKMRNDLDLWLLQPAFERTGKVSFKINEVHAFSKLRYTNFVEVTCPMFECRKLLDFLDIYDEKLVGWGVDLWFSEFFSKQDSKRDKIAIIDEISCINPRDATKSGGNREINKLQSYNRRVEVWEEIREEYGLEKNYEKETWLLVKPKFSISVVLKSTQIILVKFLYDCYKFLKKEEWRPK